MDQLHWTKFQDFYIRIGHLKVLVALLDRGRRPTDNDSIIRALQNLLCEPYTRSEALHRVIEEQYPWFAEALGKRKGRRQGKARLPEVHEALLLLGDGQTPCPSQASAITTGSVYKVLDWGRDLGLVAGAGRGNKITENGLNLRHCFEGGIDAPKVAKFLTGDHLAWNPFLLTDRERVFLLYQLCEQDRVTLEIINRIAQSQSEGAESTIESKEAARMACWAIHKMLTESSRASMGSDLRTLRVVKELGALILRELDDEEHSLEEELKEQEVLPRNFDSRRKQIRQVGVERGLWGRSAARDKPRKTQKQADHQTIPRFELLVDLGFLTKPITQECEEDPSQQWRDQASWKYLPRPLCFSWSKCWQDRHNGSAPWERHQFANAVLQSGFVPVDGIEQQVSLAKKVDFLWAAYEKSHRSFGVTPASSVCVLAMVEAVISGYCVEVEEFHLVLCGLKEKGGTFFEHIRFSGGNSLNRMFIKMKPGLPEVIKARALTLEEPVE